MTDHGTGWLETVVENLSVSCRNTSIFTTLMRTMMGAGIPAQLSPVLDSLANSQEGAQDTLLTFRSRMGGEVEVASPALSLDGPAIVEDHTG